MIKGIEFHSLLEHIFDEVKGINVSEQIQINCPRCQESAGLSHPDGKFNLEINTATRRFRCWKCDEPKFSGSLGKLLYTFGTKADYEIYKSYAVSFADYNIAEENDYEEEAPEKLVDLPSEMILFSEMDITNPEHFEAYNYMVIERKISREILLKYRIGFCVEGKYKRRIIIPSYNKNGIVNYFVARSYDEFTIKTLKKPYDNPKSDKSSIIFNEGFVNWDSTVYLVEGAFEMLSFPVNIIPMLGKTLSPYLFIKLKEIKPQVVIVLDPDAYKNAIELFYQLQNIYIGCEERVKIVKLPNNDDLDEVRKKYGNDEVIKHLRTARQLTIDDYFIRKLTTEYGKGQGYNRRESYSKYFTWKERS